MHDANPRGPLKLSTLFDRIMALRELGILLVLIVLVFGVWLVNPVFLSEANVVNILRASSFAFLIAIAMTFVFIGGQFDLSVGATVALGGVIAGLIVMAGFPVPIAVVIALLAGATVGLLNGIFVTVFGIPAFIVTLGSMFAVRGSVLVITEGHPVYPLPPEFTVIGQGEAFGLLPYPVVLGIVLAIIAHFVLTRTVYGRTVFAMGGNKETSRLAGVNIAWMTVSLFVLAGIAAALAGVLSAARLSSALSNSGTGMELLVIASVIIGGTSLFGGSGSILGTAIGTILIHVIKNAMIITRLSPYWQDVVLGLVIIAAVGIDQWRRRRTGN